MTDNEKTFDQRIMEAQTPNQLNAVMDDYNRIQAEEAALELADRIRKARGENSSNQTG